MRPSTGADWLVFVVIAVLSTLGLLTLPRLWQGPHRLDKGVPLWWYYPEALWRGYWRSVHLHVVAFWLATLRVFLGKCDEGMSGGSGRDIAMSGFRVAADVVLVGCGLVVALAITVPLFNRPRFVVPPRFRRQPGAIAEWLAHWQRRAGRRTASIQSQARRR